MASLLAIGNELGGQSASSRTLSDPLSKDDSPPKFVASVDDFGESLFVLVVDEASLTVNGVNSFFSFFRFPSGEVRIDVGMVQEREK